MTDLNELWMTEARKTEASLLRKRKQELTPIYARACLGRISNPKDAAKNLSKAQMAYDICRARYGKRIAEAALL
ncbi:hypothetical protein U5801_21420 [Lamprobacter modestohalophilus]|uniref:hypothetical protein n=1 Tax=Lamprobacter modestohalophilus TaxID=1064514 RepID=UPI002ADEF71C|nr:hypothetical protein [Lamprobacter modestohalophilus]MEA1052345.1 hypothetical protein [Lamprobacter modestohalophilus]